MFAFRKVAEYQYNMLDMKDEGLKSLWQNIEMLSSQIKFVETNICFCKKCPIVFNRLFLLATLVFCQQEASSLTIKAPMLTYLGFLKAHYYYESSDQPNGR